MGIPRKHSKNWNLSESGGRNTFLIFMEARLLERHNLAGRLLPCPINFAVSSFSNLLQLLERFHCWNSGRPLLHFSLSLSLSESEISHKGSLPFSAKNEWKVQSERQICMKGRDFWPLLLPNGNIFSKFKFLKSAAASSPSLPPSDSAFLKTHFWASVFSIRPNFIFSVFICFLFSLKILLPFLLISCVFLINYNLYHVWNIINAVKFSR